jgi:hypothetical protein
VAVRVALAFAFVGIAGHVRPAIGETASIKRVTIFVQGTDRITFSVPKAWRTLEPKDDSSAFDAVLAYAGTVPLPQPCFPTAAGRTCDFFPQHSLPRSSVVLNILSNRDPLTPRGATATLRGIPGQPISTPVGAGRLQIVYRRYFGCPMKTGRSERAYVALRDVAGVRLVLTACIRGPAARVFQGRVRGILASLRSR